MTAVVGRTSSPPSRDSAVLTMTNNDISNAIRNPPARVFLNPDPAGNLSESNYIFRAVIDFAVTAEGVGSITEPAPPTDTMARYMRRTASTLAFTAERSRRSAAEPGAAYSASAALQESPRRARPGRPVRGTAARAGGAAEK